MNITKARNQLQQISRHNQENKLFNFIELGSNQSQSYAKNKFKNPRNFGKTFHFHQTHDGFLKDEYFESAADKKQSQEKIEVKIPIFKSNKAMNFEQEQKQRFEKLGLQSFLKEALVQKTLMANTSEPSEQKIIRNLNYTYFRTTEHIKAKQKNMVNTLGIKKSSMSNYKVDWNQKNVEELQLEWKEIGYIPNKVFPCRKGTNLKNKIYAPRKSSQHYKISYQIPKSQQKLTKNSIASSFLQNNNSRPQTSKQLGTRNYSSMKKIFEQQKSGEIKRNKSRKSNLNTSKSLNRSQQLENKKQISRILIDQQAIHRSATQKRKRPWTSKDSVMRNLLISEQLGKPSGEKKFSENDRTFCEFTNSLQKSRTQKQKTKRSLKGPNNPEEARDFVVGNKISIHL